MRRGHMLATGIVMAFLIGVPQAFGQVLTAPNAVFEEGFSLIGGLRELPDGRVMVADPLGQVLVIVDLTTGVADTIGRVGQGPEEYRQPDGIFPLPGDSTLLVDLGNARLTALGPSFEFGPTMQIARGNPGGPGPGGGMLFVLPRQVDARGRLYLRGSGLGRPGAELPDSAPVIRFDRASQRIDTVAIVKIRELRRRSSGGANNRNVSIQQVPLSPADGWAVAPDGRMALVRANPYSVEWHDADGRVVQGPQIAYDPVPVRRAEKEEWVNRLSGGLMIGVDINNGQRQVSFSRGGRAARNRGLDQYPWPDRKPAFNAEAISVAPDGTLWVERSQPAGQPAVYDIFGPDGERRTQITLPAGRQVIGFGNGVVYTMMRDEFDLQYLERYAL